MFKASDPIHSTRTTSTIAGLGKPAYSRSCNYFLKIEHAFPARAAQGVNLPLVKSIPGCQENVDDREAFQAATFSGATATNRNKK